MPPKTYAIVHDGNNLLVGTGGKSGGNRAPRRGNHLPGGTIDAGEEPLSAIVREIEEETGFTDITSDQTCKTFTVPAVKKVTFCVIRVLSVPDLAVTFKRPEVVSDHDEPFEKVRSVSISDACQRDFFNADDCTDWFRDALSFAVKEGLLA